MGAYWGQRETAQEWKLETGKRGKSLVNTFKCMMVEFTDQETHLDDTNRQLHTGAGLDGELATI